MRGGASVGRGLEADRSMNDVSSPLLRALDRQRRRGNSRRRGQPPRTARLLRPRRMGWILILLLIRWPSANRGPTTTQSKFGACLRSILVFRSWIASFWSSGSGKSPTPTEEDIPQDGLFHLNRVGRLRQPAACPFGLRLDVSRGAAGHFCFGRIAVSGVSCFGS